MRLLAWRDVHGDNPAAHAKHGRLTCEARCTNRIGSDPGKAQGAPRVSVFCSGFLFPEIFRRRGATRDPPMIRIRPRLILTYVSMQLLRQ